MSATLLVEWHFDNHMRRAHAHAAQSSQLLATRCSPIEYHEAGTGVPLWSCMAAAEGTTRAWPSQVLSYRGVSA